MMRAVLVVAACAMMWASRTEAHNCMHDHPDIRSLARTGLHNVARQDYEIKHVRVVAIGAIRIGISTEDLTQPSQYCNQVGQTVSNKRGRNEFVVCEARDILTDARRNALTNNILTAAVLRLSSLLNVDQVTGNLRVTPGACPEFTIPAAHTTTGVPNVDFMLYVAAVPIRNGALAWAYTCSTDGSGRPIVGAANFGPEDIGFDTSAPAESQLSTTVATHELIHALGFTYDSFSSRTSTTQLRGKDVTVMTSPQVASRTRSYFGCTTMLGGELEDEGSSGSRLSHWDRRIFPFEMMAAVVSEGAKLSMMTLAALEDSGHYQVNYNGADGLSFAAGAGCGFSEERCDTAAGGRDAYWCFSECTWDYEDNQRCGIYRYDEPLPPEFRYFSDPNRGGAQYADFCPLKAPGRRHCLCGSLARGTCIALIVIITIAALLFVLGIIFCIIKCCKRLAK